MAHRHPIRCTGNCQHSSGLSPRPQAQATRGSHLVTLQAKAQPGPDGLRTGVRTDPTRLSMPWWSSTRGNQIGRVIAGRSVTVVLPRFFGGHLPYAWLVPVTDTFWEDLRVSRALGNGEVHGDQPVFKSRPRRLQLTLADVVAA